MSNPLDERDLNPTQAADPQPRLEEPTDEDVPTPDLPGMTDPVVPSDGKHEVIQ